MEEVSASVDKMNLNKEDSSTNDSTAGAEAVQAMSEAVEGEKKFDNDVTDEIKTTGLIDPDIKNVAGDVASEQLDYLSSRTWDELRIREDILKNLLNMGFTSPSKIQAGTYDMVVTSPYNNLIAQAPNGCGKTGAFCIPTLHRIDDTNPATQAIIFAHSGIMVQQISDVLRKMCKDTSITVDELQKNNSKPSGHIAVSTPGNFAKLLQKRMVDLKSIKVAVCDEADEMINNSAHIQGVKAFLDALAKDGCNVQFLFFSATFRQEHFNFIKKYVKQAAMIQVEKAKLTLKKVKQLYYVCKTSNEKITFIENYLRAAFKNERCIIFCNSKKYVETLRDTLKSRGYNVYLLMGGNMEKENRLETVRKFNNGEIQILITTDIIARGFDEKLCKLVINFDVPTNFENRSEPAYETYLHRIGRTGRFDTNGIGLNLVKVDNKRNETTIIEQIMKYYNSTIVEIKSVDTLIDEFKSILDKKF